MAGKIAGEYKEKDFDVCDVDIFEPVKMPGIFMGQSKFRIVTPRIKYKIPHRANSVNEHEEEPCKVDPLVQELTDVLKKIKDRVVISYKGSNNGNSPNKVIIGDIYFEIITDLIQQE